MMHRHLFVNLNADWTNFFTYHFVKLELGVLVSTDCWWNVTRCWLCSSSDVLSTLAANTRFWKMTSLSLEKSLCRVCALVASLAVKEQVRQGGWGRHTPTDTAVKNSGSCPVAPSTSLWPADFMEAVARVTLTPAGPGVSLASTEMTCPMKCWKTAHRDALIC